MKGAILYGILLTWILGMLCQVTGLYVPTPDAGFYSLFPSWGMTDFSKLGLTFGQCFNVDFSAVGIVTSSLSSSRSCSLIFSILWAR